MIHFLKKNSELNANKINTILGWTVMQTLNFLMIFFNVIFSWRRCRKAVRATGILIPLLGLQFLVFIKRPNDKDSTLYDVYTYAVAIVVSLQVSICKLGINFRSRSTACANLVEVGLGWGVKKKIYGVKV